MSWYQEWPRKTILHNEATVFEFQQTLFEKHFLKHRNNYFSRKKILLYPLGFLYWMNVEVWILIDCFWGAWEKIVFSSLHLFVFNYICPSYEHLLLIWDISWDIELLQLICCEGTITCKSLGGCHSCDIEFTI